MFRLKNPLNRIQKTNKTFLLIIHFSGKGHKYEKIIEILWSKNSWKKVVHGKIKLAYSHSLIATHVCT